MPLANPHLDLALGNSPIQAGDAFQTTKKGKYGCVKLSDPRLQRFPFGCPYNSNQPGVPPWRKSNGSLPRRHAEVPRDVLPEGDVEACDGKYLDGGTPDKSAWTKSINSPVGVPSMRLEILSLELVPPLLSGFGKQKPKGKPRFWGPHSDSDGGNWTRKINVSCRGLASWGPFRDGQREG